MGDSGLRNGGRRVEIEDLRMSSKLVLRLELRVLLLEKLVLHMRVRVSSRMLRFEMTKAV